MVGEEWGGCVEMRPWPHNVLDTYTPINTGYRTVRDSIDADNDPLKAPTDAKLEATDVSTVQALLLAGRVERPISGTIGCLVLWPLARRRLLGH